MSDDSTVKTLIYISKPRSRQVPPRSGALGRTVTVCYAPYNRPCRFLFSHLKMSGGDIDPNNIDLAENRARCLRGEPYYAFTPDLTAARQRCKLACNRYNNAGEVCRRRQVELWRDIAGDTTPLPPVKEDPAQDEAQFEEDPWIESPVRIDYGTNVKMGKDVYLNFNCTILDTCPVTIGSRTLIAANVSLYTATHPLDPALRNGTKGPELGKEIHIGEDCFIGGSVVILPGVKIGNGVTVGAGSVVTKDVPDFCVVAGNPAKLIKRLEPGSKTEPDKNERVVNVKNEKDAVVDGANSR